MPVITFWGRLSERVSKAPGMYSGALIGSKGIPYGPGKRVLGPIGGFTFYFRVSRVWSVVVSFCTPSR